MQNEIPHRVRGSAPGRSPRAPSRCQRFNSAASTRHLKLRKSTWEQQARAIPDAARIGEFIKRYSNQPHLAGTPQSKQTAEAILAQLREYGLDAHIEQFEALLPTPKTRVLEMTAPVRLRAQARRSRPSPATRIRSDAGMVPPYNAYSGDGDVTAPLVYVNYGLPADYDVLARTRHRRQGQDRHRALWPQLPRHQSRRSRTSTAPSAASFIPIRATTATSRAMSIPKARTARRDGVQRGSLLDLTLYPGDPLSPGWASEPGSQAPPARAKPQTIMKIPVLPISYGDAQPLLANLDRPRRPRSLARRAAHHLSSRAGMRPASI